MSTAYIREYQAIGRQYGALAAGKEPALFDQTVAIGGVHAESSAFSAATNLVRLHVDVNACFLFGKPGATVATLTSARMAAGQTEYFVIDPGDVVSVIASS